ncbi:MAG: flagellar biosynthesis protein FlgD [Buchnera aphidicola (Pentalonia nigronervosa)]|jgi:flagellar basal-body rod modification protein FlgD|uniref:Basal-body rod modification protein FlgD n=1 Tax=Buchnera aphidicola (Pentalonia nigronervosa) TaxID=1309793 RepID=A0A7H1AZW2_9GAMM|nr:MAG: flagellar biosynthesis protein FlgD [Buchnera aphidicola (Pentalonia nigronervosa)]
MSIIDVNTHEHNSFIETVYNDAKKYSTSLDLQKNFLNLLIAQIKNQDPTDPIKNTDLTSQLAQINSAIGIDKLNNAVNNVSNQIQKNRNVQVSSLIGRRVMIPSTQMIHTHGIETKFGIELIGYATTVKIQVKDNNGNIVHLQNIKNVQPGVHIFQWDGKNLNNEDTSTGRYNVFVEAANKEQLVPVSILNEALVNSIITVSGDPIIDLGILGNTKLSKIRAILK